MPRPSCAPTSRAPRPARTRSWNGCAASSRTSRRSPPTRSRLVFGEVDGTVDSTELADAAREALTNVRKHARASQVVVSCHATAGAGTVVVTDDGIGFDPARTARGTGLRESIVGRMERAGGSAEIDSEAGAGTSVTLKVHTPLHAMEAA